MAIFKVGQRVRVVRALGQEVAPVPDGYEISNHNGKQGTVVDINSPRALGRFCIQVELDGEDNFLMGFLCCADELEPLTDPLADAFIERIKKLQPLKEPSHV